jgi:hypothetical protein
MLNFDISCLVAYEIGMKVLQALGNFVQSFKLKFDFNLTSFILNFQI